MRTKREESLKQGKKKLLKRCFTLMLAFTVVFTSVPIQKVWAGEAFYEQPGDNEMILDDSIEEGELGDLDLSISHSVSKKGDKATVRVSAMPSETGLEHGVTKVTKVETYENGKTQKGKRVDKEWQFTVEENGVYSFMIYYNSDEGEEILAASPSDALGAGDFTVKKAVIAEYEITNLFPEGDPEDIDVDIFDELTEEGAMITLLVEPSEIGLEKGVSEITDISLIDFEPEEEGEIIDGSEISIATDSEAEEEIIEEEMEIEDASPSNAAYDTSKSSSAKDAEYRAAESAEGEYHFFVKKNGTYTFSIRYSRLADVDFEDSAELVETQFSTTYELDSIENGVQFTGVEDVTIQAGETFDLMEGVSAVTDLGMKLPVVVQDNGRFDPIVPGTYHVVYSVEARTAIEGGSTERVITVMPKTTGSLRIVSDIHGEESEGKTLEVPVNREIPGILSVSYDLPAGVNDRVLKIAWPEGTTSSTYPTDNISGTYQESIDGISYKCLRIKDAATGEITFDLRYTINYDLSNAGDEKKKAYLDEYGKLNIGQIHLIATTEAAAPDEAPLAEAGIGPFTTRREDAGASAEFRYYLNYSSAPYTDKVELDQNGQFIKGDYILGHVAEGKGVYLNINDNRRKPMYILKVRLYAPRQYAFEIDTQDIDKGVEVGVDEGGNAYMDFPYSEYRDTMNSLFNRTKLIVQDKSAVPDTGLHRSKSTTLFCLGYGGTEEEITVNSLLTLDVSKVDFQKADLLNIRDYDTAGTTLYQQEESTAQEYRVSNSSVLLGEENKINHWAVPEDRENITISVSYPEELQAREFDYYETGEIDKHIGASVIFEKIVLHLESGETVELRPGQRNDGSVNPADSHVDSADYVFKELYGRDVVIQTKLEVKTINIQEQLEVRSTGAIKGKDRNAQHTYKITPAKALEIGIQFKNMPISMLNPNKDYEGQLNIESKYWGTRRITTNPEIVFEDEKILQFFTGSMRFDESLAGGKVNYTTSLGRKGELEIPAGGKCGVDNLQSGERLTRLVITKEGITYISTTITTLMTFGLEFTRSDIENEFQLVEGTATVEASVKFSSEELENPDTLTTEAQVKLLWDSEFGKPYISTESRNNVYQGDTYEIGMGSIIVSKVGGTGLAYSGGELAQVPMYATVYVKLEHTDKFVFAGGDESAQYELIDKPDGKYLKIIPKENQLNLGDFINYIRLPKVKFMVLPGAALGEFPVMSDVYVDINKMLEYSEEYRTKYCVNVYYRELIEDSLDLTESGDDGSLHMWKVDTKNFEIKTKILQQNLASVVVKPGISDIYGGDNRIFNPSDRKHLNSLVSIGSALDVIKDYKIHIPLPRKGNLVLSSNGTLEDVSEYDVFLRNEPRFMHGGIDYETQYKLENETAYISAAEVGDRWDEVIEIYIEIATLPAKGAVTVYLDLEAEDKSNVGLGEKQAYIAAEYQYNHGDIQYGSKATYTYQDYQITGRSWIDNNENGKYDKDEPLCDNTEIVLLQNNGSAPSGSYKYTSNHGEYTITTYLDENLSLEFKGLDGTTEGIKPTLEKDGTNESTSVFARENTWLAQLPSNFDENQSGYDLGIVKLPILMADNIQVGYKSEAQAKVTVKNQANAPAVNRQIIYGAAKEPSIASINDTGLIKGLKDNSLTTATASVKNSLGDEVTTTYQIAVSENRAPILNVHPWVALQGDRIPNLWYGVTIEEPEEKYPAWKALLLGANKSVRTISDNNRTVKIYKNASYTDEISVDDALEANGLYYVRYSIKDHKENIVTADTTLEVIGRMQNREVVKHYFANGDTVDIPEPDFYYLDINGAEVPVTEGVYLSGGGGKRWSLNKEGVVRTSYNVMMHPELINTSKGVEDGEMIDSWSRYQCTVKAYVDSEIKIEDKYPDEYTAIQNEPVESIGWDKSSGQEGYYYHYKANPYDQFDSYPKYEWRRPKYIVGCDNTVIYNDTIEVDTSKPGIYEYFRAAIAEEDYDNVDSEGKPIKNSVMEKSRIIVISQPSVNAPDTIYITPDEGNDEEIIKEKIAATATYHDGTNPNAVVPENQILYKFNKEDETITSVDITAWGGRTDNRSDSVHVKLVVRDVPVLNLPDLHLRKGTAYGPEDFADRVLIPEDEHNEYACINNNLDTNTLGKYEASYKVSDNLTGTVAEQSQTIYVHGIPEIIAADKNLYTHQSTSEQALIDIVKKSVKATVEYTTTDGKTEVKTIGADDLQYEVSDYIAGTAGRFKVTITANDAACVPAGLEPMQVTKDVYVDVVDKRYTVVFEMGEHGGLENPADAVAAVAHGKSPVSPALAPEEGYEIDYWTDESGTRVNLASVVITADRRFTAAFKIKVFTVRFIGKQDRVIKTELVEYGHDATPPTAEEDEDVKNSKFNGWSKSYQNIKADTDIYATYDSSHGGGGGHSSPSGPEIEIHGPETPKGSPELIPIGSNPVPAGNITPPTAIGPNASMDEMMLLPKTGDMTNGKQSWLSYDVKELEDGESRLEGVPSQPESGLAEAAADRGRRCILHIILLGAALLEGVYYWFKKRRDQKELKELDEELSGLKEKEAE